MRAARRNPDDDGVPPELYRAEAVRLLLASNYIHPVVLSGNLAMFWKIDPKRRASLRDLTDVAAKVLNEGTRHYHANTSWSAPTS